MPLVIELPRRGLLGNPPRPSPMCRGCSGGAVHPQSPEHPLLQDAVVAGAFTAEKLPREEGEVVLGYRVQIPAL